MLQSLSAMLLVTLWRDEVNALTHSISMQNARIMSMYTITKHSMRICSFCNFHHLKLLKPMKYTLLRRSSTIDTLELHTPLKKKIKRRSKKYAELLEVRDQATNNTRASVCKLNSAHVSALVDQPDVTLDRLHKVTKTISTEAKNPMIEHKKKSNLFKNEMDIIPNSIFQEFSEDLQDTDAIMEDLMHSGMNDYTTLIKDSFFLETLQQKSKNSDEDIDQHDAHVQISEYNKSSDFPAIPFTKEKDKFQDCLSAHNLMSQLLAYIDIYMQIKMPEDKKAHEMLKVAQLKRLNSKISTAPLYNMLMEAYISSKQLQKQKKLQKVLEVYEMMKTHSVQRNAKTYTILFHLIADMKNRKLQEELVAKLKADMHSNGIFFDDVMNVMMNVTRRNAILQCIRLINPEYQIQYRDIDIAHECKLLQNLTTNSNCQSPAKGVVTMDELQSMVRTQLDMEKQCKLEVKKIVLFNGDPHIRQQAINRIAKLEESWKSSVTEVFEENRRNWKKSEIRSNPMKLNILYPFLYVLPKEEYVNAIICEINQRARASDLYSVSTTKLYYNLGNNIYKKYEFQRKSEAGVLDSEIEVYEEYLKWYLQVNPADKSINGRVKWQELIQKANRSGVYSDITVLEWPRHILINIGKFLYNIILNGVKISHKLDAKLQIPAFYLKFGSIKKKNETFLVEEIKLSPDLHKLYKDADPETLTFDTVLLPMCSPPRPWVDINIGGFLFSKTNFVRDSYTKLTPVHLIQNTSMKQLYPTFDCLNQLGSIPWRINVSILDILIQIFQQGGSEELNIPQPPSVLPSLSDLLANETEKDHNKKMQLKDQLRNQENKLYSLWCDCLYKLSLANYFKNKVFWLPHNLDFRGRTYPLPPHLTHLGSDLSRSILIFAQKKPLGPKGLDWLKIHTINLTGLKKKEPTYKRLEYANEVLDLILDSAQNPLTGKMWWTKSDEPWQTLAACKEINNALQSPNVEEYMSGFPIHQDGSCNGLQHYAALGRDQIGAESVNVYPSDKPQDVYSVIVGMVEEFRKADAAAGNEIAKILEGHITRKVIKQTVMTTVYGVTKYGANTQIARQLNDLKDFDKKYILKSSPYLTEQTFKAIRTMFTSAREIQDWFTLCSKVISTRCNQYVQWVTPLGLPVMQPYFNRGKSATSNKIVNKPNTAKQKNAFPPNFIHSLDSCHMMLTSLHCEQAGITFISVHDCFWTHPCTVNIMSKVCREQFVVLHSEPILEDLSMFLKGRYKHYFINKRIDKQENTDLSLEVFNRLPKRGTFDIKSVLSSEYFFS